MARPAGEMRRTLREAVLDLQAAMPLRELLRLMPASRGAARSTVRRMVGAGELEPVGTQRTGTRGRPAVLYRPVVVCALPVSAAPLGLQ